MASPPLQSLIPTPGVSLAILATGQNPDGSAFVPSSGFTPTVITVTNPAAGADFVLTVPAATYYTIIGIQAQFATSASAGNRVTNLAMGNGTNFPIVVLPSTNQAASITNQYAWTNSVQPSGFQTGGPYVVQAVPRVCLAPTFQLKSLTSGILAGDQWSNIFVYAYVSTAPVS